MSLYLAVIDPETEKEHFGVEIGPYSYFGEIRYKVGLALAENAAATACKTFLAHYDCFGEWPIAELEALRSEILHIQDVVSTLPSQYIIDNDWYINLVRREKLKLDNLLDCMIDVDGTPLFDGILSLIDVAEEKNLPIIFQ